LLVGRIAGDFPAGPGWRHKFSRLRRKLNLGQDNAGQYSFVDVNLPRMVAVRDEVPGLCQPGPEAMVGHHFLGVGQGYVILEFDIRQTCRLRLDGQGCSLIADPHAHFAILFEGDQSVPDLLLTCDLAAPTVVANQEFSFDLDGHARLAVRGSTPPGYCNAGRCNGTATWSQRLPGAPPHASTRSTLSRTLHRTCRKAVF